VEVDGGPVDAAAVISAVDPWTHLRLDPRGLRWADRRRLARARPALAPAVSHAVVEDDPVPGGVAELVEHHPDGPVVRYRRALGERTLVSTHDSTAASPDPSYGIAWDGAASWWRMPPVTTGRPLLWTAGPHSRGGSSLSQVLLSGALASYACHDALSGVPAAPVGRVR
ncbi:hypothetical protein, partial [Desertihabitans aurantiacus]|uniref:hypothetical protein n=1 Tax=Desertihabitans aurantiacus TaxID=2282477 RepID=UPI0038B96513